MILWTTLAAAYAACPDPAGAIDDAFAALETGDMQRVATRLEEAEAGLGCGPVATSDLLGRFWLARGVLDTLEGRTDEASDAFALARKMDPALRVDAWGDEVRGLWSAAATPSGQGTLSLVAPLDRRESFWIDGKAAELPATTTPGNHLVQVTRFGTAVWADRVYVAADVPLTLEVVRPPAAELPKQWSGTPMLSLSADAASGERRTVDSEGETWTQQPTRVGIPLEIGWQFSTQKAWFRPAALLAPLVTSPYLYAGEEEPVRFPLAFGAGVEGGVVVGEARLGALAQAAYPGQVRLRAAVAVEVAEHFEIEGRLGTNLVTQGPAEPAGSVGVVWLPRG